MTKAVAVRREGDAFQARVFWRKAACLLDPTSPIVRVGFESGPKGFDDVWVEYSADRAPCDQYGQAIMREHIQCKWHVSINAYGYADLTSPDWINATSTSLLQRARNAQVANAPNGIGVRFKLLTNWGIAQDDPLSSLIYQRSKTLRLEDLFGTKTDASATGRIRKLWREHLGIDDSELRYLARTLSLDTDTTSLDDHRENLDLLFENRGLRRIPGNESSFVYDDLTFQWLGQGRLDFDRASFRDACKREGLLSDGGKVHTVFGIKSFEHAFDRLEDRCTIVLDLIPYFDERAIRDQAEWVATLQPKLKQFLQDAARDNQYLRLILDAHITLAFVAGSVLNIKSGRNIELEQRTQHRHVWNSNDTERDANRPSWNYEIETLNGKGNDMAVAVSLTHDVGPAVRNYITKSAPQIGKLLVARPSCGPGALSVASGKHAFDLAEALVLRINEEQVQNKVPLHLFVAAPNAFTFFMGQRQPGLGLVTLYEYDFEGQNGSTYTKSLELPI
ncbi:MAG: SAVED domain-containing protein [Nitrosomonadales bacterium]|nr:SAVED domain-containing protein [Nitrosomonadales bacterium]